MPVTYRALIEQASDALRESSDTPKIDAEVLLQHTVKQNSAWLLARAEEAATEPQVQHFEQLLNERKRGQPIAYLIGYKDFWTLRLKVNQYVLIPRADTETLVEQVLERIDKTSAYDVLDLGTGSGAIALSVAKERPLAQVVAADADSNALKVAKSNCAAAKLPNVEFVQSDWFDAIDNRKFDLILANPPYISEGDPHLDNGDLRFEPEKALVAGDDGLADLHAITNDSVQHIRSGGWLIVEHGYNQQTAVSELFTRVGYTSISTYHDLNKLPRCTAGQFNLP